MLLFFILFLSKDVKKLGNFNIDGIGKFTKVMILFLSIRLVRQSQQQQLNKIKNKQNISCTKIHNMKGTASVNPLFQPLQITHPHIYSINPLIVTDPHRLYFRTSQNQIRWQHKSIINGTYSQKLNALMILSQQGKLHIFTQNLQQISRIPWQSKYSVGLQFIDSKNMFLMIGATDIQIQYVKIYSNIKSTKFVSSMNFAIQKKDKYIADPQTKLQWNKGYNYNQAHNLLYVWSSKDINFYQLDNLQIKAKIVSLTRKDLSITYCLYNFHYKYTITGLVNGQIKVWRLPQNSINCSPKDYILIHKFVGHSKQVDKIVDGSDERIIISGSEQLMICLWSLQTFQLLRQYDFLSDYSRIYLYNSIYSLAVRDNELGKLKYGKHLQFITDITSQIIFVQKYRKQPKMTKQSPIQSIQLTLASNLGFQIRNDQLDSKDLNKIQIQYIYPPLKAKGIQQIIANPFKHNQYYLLVQSGQIFRLRIQNNSGKIQQSYMIQRTKDVQFHQLNQIPTQIKFLSIVPPEYDSQINQNTIQKKQKKQVNQQDKYLELKLITIGCNKGTVVFLRTNDFQYIYTRVTYHREAIVMLDCFKVNGYSYLVSHCVQQYLKFVRFDSEKANCILSIFTGSTITFIKGLQDRVAIVLKKGFFQIFQMNKQQKCFCIKNSKSLDHEQQIITIDSDPQRKLLLTAALDNKIKIWTYHKILLYQIILDEGLKNAIWFRPFQMLISHNLKILYFKNIGFKITEKQIQEINQQFLETTDEEPTNIQQIIKNMKLIKNYQKNQIHKSGYKEQQSRIKQSKVVFRTKDKEKQKQKISQKLKQSFVSQESPKKVETVKKISQSQPKKKQKAYNISQQQHSKPKMSDKEYEAFRKHINQIDDLRKQTNQSILPKIKPKNQDAFENFMKSKLINKKILTRRDITLNRIIMKNIIKEHFGTDNQITNHLKLDF